MNTAIGPSKVITTLSDAVSANDDALGCLAKTVHELLERLAPLCVDTANVLVAPARALPQEPLSSIMIGLAGQRQRIADLTDSIGDTQRRLQL